MCNCRQTDFFKTFFSFFHFLKHPVFRVVASSKMTHSLVRGVNFRSLMPIFGTLWGWSPGAVFMSKAYVLLKVFLVVP